MTALGKLDPFHESGDALPPIAIVLRHMGNLRELCRSPRLCAVQASCRSLENIHPGCWRLALVYGIVSSRTQVFPVMTALRLLAMGHLA